MITAYIETWFDVDKKFGIKTFDEDDTWVNFYGKYNINTCNLILEYCIDRADSSEWHEYKPTKNEKLLMIGMMEECCKTYYSCTLKEYYEELKEIDIEQGGLS